MTKEMDFPKEKLRVSVYIDDDESVHLKKGSERYLTETNNVPGSINIYFTHE